MIRALLRWESLAASANPAGWVFRVGLNWARSILRRRRGPARVVYDADHVDLPSIADPAIHRALGRLPVRQRSVVVCRHLLGWTEAETAEARTVRIGTVKSRLHRALASLAVELDHLRP